MLHQGHSRVSAFVLAACALGACTPAPSENPAATGSPSASAPPPASVPGTLPGTAPGLAPSLAPQGASAAPTAFPVPTGPRLAIVAGQGVGAIRLGATVATVERLMQAPCDEKTPAFCRYLARAVEFQLGDDGKVKRIVAHRQGRKAGDKTYGVFHGAIPPDLMFGMIPAAIQQYLGPPERVIDSNQGATPDAAYQHVYKGLVLEYDKLPTGRTVLGGARIPD